MKRILMLLSFCFVLPVFGQDPVVMIVEEDTVGLSEFLYIFNKNREDKPIDKKEITEYMDLFLNFKLKVAEAEQLGMDTLPSFQKELETYRKQLAKPYLIDKEIKEHIVDEVFERLQWEIRASHILIMVDENASPEDTLKAYNKIRNIKGQIDGGADFVEMAKLHSEDPSVTSNGGDIGYFSALYLVYPFENVAYNTEPGQVSDPVRTQFGYHLIKVSDRRPAQGERLTAHIMIKLPENATAEEMQNAEKKINEIYDRAMNGGDFEQLARQFSEDPATSSKGGELPWFGTNKMVQSFEEATFALDSIGQISEPVLTPYGWHIIRLLGKKGPPTREQNEYDIRQRIEHDSRSNLSQRAVIERLKKEYGYKTYPNRLKEFEKVVDDSFYSYKWSADRAGDLDRTMFILDGIEYTQTQFSDYLVEAMKKGRHNKDISIMLRDVYEDWVNERVLIYEESKLDEKYMDFRMLYQEYRDGILLFELMRERVWDKPMRDSAGLAGYYESHLEDYMWPQRIEAEVWSCETEKIAKKVEKYISAGKSADWILDKMNVQSELSAQVSKGLYIRGTNAPVDSTNWKVGVHAPISWDGRFYAVNVKAIHDPEPKTLEECRGLAVTDYQNYLEEALINELRERFHWEVFPEALNNIK